MNPEITSTTRQTLVVGQLQASSGCYDAYRLIWEADHAEGVIIVLRAGEKKRRDGTIYDEPRPITGRWAPSGSERRRSAD